MKKATCLTDDQRWQSVLARDPNADGEAKVNGEVETRRGRQLHPGDVIELFGEQVQITRTH